ncbi:hypothetical protein Hdeb2414_s0438g00893691 [Helianthus debilis subsp. tardiflorus]
MAKTVLAGLKASTSNFMTFRVSAKLTEDITMLVNVPRFLKIRFEGLRVEINSQNLVYEEQGPKLQLLSKVWELQTSGGPPGRPYAGRDPCPDAELANSSLLV